MANIKNWLLAFRLRTLPLSLTPVIAGSGMAYKDHTLKPEIFVFTLLTALFLQILSNLANDYGDFIKGTDNENRIGEKRALQSGIISKQSMKIALWIFGLLSFFSGIILLTLSYDLIQTQGISIMLALGVACIVAAITYTIGKKSYGYIGLGDFFVIIFFGLIGVAGSYYLQTGKLHGLVLLPALSVGFFSAAVLNINNMRDYANDKNFGKKTLVVIMGVNRAKKYHALLLTSAMLCMIAYSYIQTPQQGELIQFLYLITFPVFILNMIDIYENDNPNKLDNKLKPLALAAFTCSLLFAAGLIIAYYK
jgi:1,4-dihydroxy-2-naphthoate octaprenyltransferase